MCKMTVSVVVCIINCKRFYDMIFAVFVYLCNYPCTLYK